MSVENCQMINKKIIDIIKPLKDKIPKEHYTVEELLEEFNLFDTMSESFEIKDLENCLSVNQLFDATKKLLKELTLSEH